MLTARFTIERDADGEALGVRDGREPLAGVRHEPAAERRLDVVHREKVPLAGHALEFAGAAVAERDTRPYDEVLDRARDDHLIRAGECADTCADVDGHPPMSSPMSSHSPVCRPARSSMFRDRT